VRSMLLVENAHPLFDSSQIPGHLLNVLVVRTASLASDSAAVEALIRGWFRALDHFRDQPLDAAARMAPRLGIEADTVLESFSGIQLPTLEDNRVLLAGPEPFVPVLAQGRVGLLMKERLLARRIAVGELIDGARLLKENP
jgi:NitT/TauT family transport system substrate-binding protein